MSKLTKRKKNEVTPKKTAIEMPEKSQETSPTPAQQAPPVREIRIETDGTSVKVVKAEVTNLEFQAVLENLLRNFHQGK